MGINQPPSPSPAPIFTVNSTVVAPTSAEVAFALREDQFQTLCEGETSGDRATRDLFLGLFFGAVVGLLSVLATTDWTTIWQAGRREWFIACLIVLTFLIAASGVGAIICWLRFYRTRHNSSYSRLRSRMETFFESLPNQSIGAPQQNSPSGHSGGSRARWENVGNVFWLCGDLVGAAEMAHRDPKPKVVHALEQAHHHISELGLAESSPAKQIFSLKSEIANLSDTAFDEARRTAFRKQIYGITGAITAMLREQQPTFRPNPQS